MRQSATPRTFFAASPGPRGASGAARGVPALEGAGRGGRLMKLGLMILASPVLAVAGIAYLVLLPICGIASLLEGFLGAAWNWVRADAQDGAAARRSAR